MTQSLESLPSLLQAGAVWLQVGQLIDGESAVQKDAHLIFDAEKVLYVGSGDDLPSAEVLRPGQTEPDYVLPQYTALPGLTDGHTHIFLEGMELDFGKRKAYQSQPADALLQAAVRRSEKLLKHGVVAMRDGGDKDGVGLKLSRLKGQTGQSPAAEVYSPGPGINRIKRYGSFFCEPFENFTTAAQVVDDRIARGADHIKIVPTGIINFAKAAVVSKPQYTVEEVRALCDAAHARSKHVMAHASGTEGIGIAIEGRVDTIEHGFFINDAQLERMAELGSTWVPTFAPVQKQVDYAEAMGWGALERDNLQRILDGHAQSLRWALEIGVRVLVGSDAGSCGVGHADGLFYEMELLERAGMASLNILNAATAGNASHLLGQNSFGRLTAGQNSRFILTTHNPLKTVTALREPKTVVFDGNIYDSCEADMYGF
jgi:imidazolonepropionase-like amidohydrolase